MARKYFGTDGIRGTANKDPMTAEIALKLGKAAGVRFANRGDYRHRVVIGKDTRLSGYMIEPALTAGFISVGMDVILVGPLPTPAIAMLTRSLRADLGVMISASHNAFQDNGIKLFGPDGYKLSDEVELAIEADIDNSENLILAAPDKLGRATRLDDARGRYIEFAKGSFPRDQLLNKLKIVVDCANGAAYKVAPTVLWELEAEVIAIGDKPDGFNINKDCGSTSTEAMCRRVVEEGADLGIALDGDADRLIMCDEKGNIVDGDQLMALIARSWADRGLLNGGGLVATVMSNMGLEKYLEGHGLSLIRTAVGDRYVVEHMRSQGYNLGGEQSGHMVMSDFGTTGDGLIAALQVLSVIVKEERPVSEICKCFEPYPQILKNVRYSAGQPLEDENVKSAISAGEEKLASSGRLLIRKSGTEPLIRVMGEGEDPKLVEQVVDDIVAEVQKAAG
ncbi:phosphoglucosamine mutase [Sneathiella sp. P13V-1]|uniref:phosphoglucosamine mutase n=1 Tax=Sneathiella sp. P13V-1 TaxID=2697366 RepID=UPI00187B9DA9|nr:phosphoglucosamine mutase [Sneathiella sp. P13V-1]MBE7637962.1 phosphoglucosamine mutase [Sneathiella sp. P13V-1]